MKEEIRVRFAPSPTGHLHIGGARSALFNYLFARHHGGSFIVRIEDTDQSRNVDTATEKLLESLKWLGLDWDESVDKEGEYGPYKSMDRLDIYQKYVDQLLEEGKAYHDYMTTEELEKERETQRAKGETPMYSGRDRYLSEEEKQAYEAKGLKPVVRFLVPENQEIVVHDEIRGEVTFDSNGIGDFVIVRQDGIPTYNFAVTIDDHLMKISHVIRGEEHLTNTPSQVLIYEALGFEAPVFGHASLILNADHKKMSKRDESIIQFVEQYRELGYLPEAIVNFIALLGWSPGGEKEILSLKELEEQFQLDRVIRAPAVFDTQKLEWMNNQYMKEESEDRVVWLALPHLQKAGRLPENMTEKQRQWAYDLIVLHQEKMSYGAQIVELTELFFREQIDYNEEAQAVIDEEQVPEVMASFREKLYALDTWEPEDIKKSLKEVQKETGHKGKKLFMPVRVAVTGQMHGPDLPKTIILLGKDLVIKRLDQLLAK